MKTVTFYHSLVCPRCHVAGLSLSKLLQEFPDVTVNKVEYLTNLGPARKKGVKLIPALVSGESRLSGIHLSKKKIRQFLESL